MHFLLCYLLLLIIQQYSIINLIESMLFMVFSYFWLQLKHDRT
ncbi:hypothetical protein CLOSTHATH_00055 [Hungatella hathewayi DSM 13479]|uniref:Uncharacterized protein n=1 Tax=Hungatella hathewayi DSM 13479 TaxID=566550 RepID=D3A8Y5_9FIRM|nr:hypothetical protein CLOSTHATH_00055 [Hungatella hathewayi DSM 13479]